MGILTKGFTVLLSLTICTFSLGQIKAGLYENSKETPILELINQAKKSLDIEIYEMDDPKVIKAIRSALDRNVKVRIVKEPVPVGASCRVFEELEKQQQNQQGRSSGSMDNCDDQTQLVEDVIDAGGEYVPFEKSELCDEKKCLEHGKILIADSKYALISSGNFNTTNLCDLDYKPSTCNRDYTYISEDKVVVSTLKAVFEKDIKGKKYDIESVIPEEANDDLTIGPKSLAPIIKFIKSAKKNIQIQNQYLKDPNMNQALMDAAERGVDVQVNVASACAFGKPSETEINKLTDIFESFEQSGIEIKMFNKKIKVNGKNGYLHAKAIVIDGVKAWMGSVNGSTQAATINREYGVFFSNKIDVDFLSKTMKSDFNHENEETWEESLECAENK